MAIRSAALAAWHEAGEYFVHASRRTFFRAQRNGVSRAPTLLLIHGFPTASFDWHLLWPGLTPHFHVFAPDLLGFGFSDKPREHRYCVADQADRIEALLAAEGIVDAHVLAHDLGGTVAQELLARTRDRGTSGANGFRVWSAILLNGGLFPEQHRAHLIQRLLASPVGAVVSRLLDERRFRSSFAEVFGPQTQPDADALADSWHLIHARDGHRLAHKLIGYIAERRHHRERWVGALVKAQPPIPLRLINGLLDPISGAHMVARYRELVPGPDVVELSDIGHYPQLEAPARVLAACLDFWRRHGIIRDREAGQGAVEFPHDAV